MRPRRSREMLSELTARIISVKRSFTMFRNRGLLPTYVVDRQLAERRVGDPFGPGVPLSGECCCRRAIDAFE
jgi:hypothetical protein